MTARASGDAGQGGKRAARRTVQPGTAERRARSIPPPGSSGRGEAGPSPGAHRPASSDDAAGQSPAEAPAGEARARAPFKFSAQTRVGFSDTDAQGVVYYGRYMPYFDLARVEYHRSLDMLRAEPGDRQFVMRAMTVEYHAPARFDDPIEVDVRISRIGSSSVTYEFAAYLAGDVLAVTATQTLVLVDLARRRPCPVPDWWRERIGAFEGADLES